MTAEPDLLPSSIAAFTEALHGDRGSLDAWLEANDEHEVAAHVEAYARANVEHAVAPLQAEVEALRAEVDFLGSVIATHAADTREYQKRISRAEAEAEQLAEALAMLPDEIAMVEHNPDDGPLMFCCGREVNDLGPRGLLITHDEGCWYARMRALRDHDQEDRND